MYKFRKNQGTHIKKAAWAYAWAGGWREYWHEHASARARAIVHVLLRATILGTLCIMSKVIKKLPNNIQFAFLPMFILISLIHTI
jgi:hypothetical protein